MSERRGLDGGDSGVANRACKDFDTLPDAHDVCDGPGCSSRDDQNGRDGDGDGVPRDLAPWSQRGSSHLAAAAN
jgi:hypothetical protein